MLLGSHLQVPFSHHTSVPQRSQGQEENVEAQVPPDAFLPGIHIMPFLLPPFLSSTDVQKRDLYI